MDVHLGVCSVKSLGDWGQGEISRNHFILLRNNWRESVLVQIQVLRKGSVDVYILLYLKWKTSRDLLYSTGALTVLCGSLSGRGVWGEWIHVYIWLSAFAVCLETTNVVNWLHGGDLFTKSGPTLATP